MTEGLGMSAMIETPVVVIDVQRAGPSTGVPTKTEQGDLWQMLGAGFGDFPRVIAAPTDILDCFNLVPEIFNIADRFQCPGIILSDLLLSEGRSSIDPKELAFNPKIDRGELITAAENNGKTTGYKRYKITESGVSPRAIPGVPGHVHTVERAVRPPELMGEPGAAVTLIGWGSTKGVIGEAVEILNSQGIRTNQLQIRWLVPLHGQAIVDILKTSGKRAIIVENNYSGQFARYLRSETSYVPDGHIRKYDGEPFMPHHIVDSVKEQLAGRTNLSVPMHEIMV